MRRILFALLIAVVVTGCGGGGGRSQAQVVACLKKEGLVATPPSVSALVNPTGLRYELDVGLTPGQPPSPGTPEATIDMFQTTDQATQYVTGGEDHRGPAVVTTTADAPSDEVKAVERCAF